MNMHQQLAQFSDSLHIQQFNQVLDVILQDIRVLGAAPPIVEVIPIANACPNASDRIRWILAASDYRDTEEIMRVETNFNHCPVQICIPVEASGKLLPFFMHIKLPAPIYGSAEFRPGPGGGTWHVIPKNHIREEHLAETIPPVNFGLEKTPAAAGSIKFGHALDITDDQRTEWTIHCAFDGEISPETPKKCFRKFMQAIPRVVSMLELWKESKMDVHMKETIGMK